MAYCSSRLLDEDPPTFRHHTGSGTGQTIISGMGELHLEVIVERLLREFNLQVNVGGRPQVAYRETIRGASRGEGKFVRQTGGRGGSTAMLFWRSSLWIIQMRILFLKNRSPGGSYSQGIYPPRH